MVTGPMPRNPKATRPKAKTDSARMSEARPRVLIRYATAIKPTMTTPPIQKAEKLPAVRPERMLSDAPPSLDAVTTSLTWREWVDVKKVVTSGMIAPASVAQVMIEASFHQNWPSARSLIQA